MIYPVCSIFTHTWYIYIYILDILFNKYIYINIYILFNYSFYCHVIIINYLCLRKQLWVQTHYRHHHDGASTACSKRSNPVAPAWSPGRCDVGGQILEVQTFKIPTNQLKIPTLRGFEACVFWAKKTQCRPNSLLLPVQTNSIPTTIRPWYGTKKWTNLISLKSLQRGFWRHSGARDG